MLGLSEYGAPGTIRTYDRLVRSQVLYPAELRARRGANYVEVSVASQALIAPITLQSTTTSTLSFSR